MASIAEIRAAIEAANFTASEAQAAARASIEKLDEVLQQYNIALDGSGNDSVSVATNSINHAKEQMEQAIQAVSGAIENTGAYVAGL